MAQPDGVTSMQDAEENVVRSDGEPNLITVAPSVNQFQQSANDGGGSAQPSPQKQLSISAIKQLRLQQLEETMRLKEEYLREKYKILCEDEEEENCMIGNNFCPDIGATQECGTDVCNIGANTATIQQQVTHNVIGEEQPPQSLHAPAHTTAHSVWHNASHNAAQQNVLPQFLASTANSPHHLLTTTTNINNLSSRQLAARQCVSKDLPVFNGDPQEWHIFISAYEQSTQMAGYSNHENLIRLQKCLRGKARDIVRNLLVLPDMVPDIICTLRMYFGRPEHILKKLIEKARLLPLPKGKLDLLIDFAFAIKNIVATIHASKLTNYLNSPMLLQELVDKLTQEAKLNWAIYSMEMQNPNLQDFYVGGGGMSGYHSSYTQHK